MSPQYEASSRIWFFDAAVDRYLPDVAQFVILGAGFDTRAYRLPSDTRVRVFEIDSPQTQMVKRETGLGRPMLVSGAFARLGRR